MDIYDFSHRYNISVKKARRIDADGRLRLGKSALRPYWQKVRSDIRKGIMSARSIALAYRYPEEVEKIMELSSAQRKVIAAHFRKAELPQIVPAPVDLGFQVSTLVWGAATGEPGLPERFIEILKSHIPETPVDYYYVAVRILLMCKDDFGIDYADKDLRRALKNAKGHPAMNGWWHLGISDDGGKQPTIYQRPKVPYDL